MQTHHQRRGFGTTLAAAMLVVLAGACGGGDEPPAPAWEIVTEGQPGALLSVWGSSAEDLWAVGADARDGSGPLVLRVRAGQVERVATGESAGDLWWVHGFAGGPVFMGGSGGVILRYQDGAFTKMSTPGPGTVFGLWGSSPTDMWAVGGASGGGGGFAWRLEGDAWAAEPSLPAEVADAGALWKVHGVGAEDAWLVGENGLSFHWDGDSLEPGDTGVGSSLFTVYGRGGSYAAVGGLASGIIVEHDGSGWQDVTPDPLPDSLTGVVLDEQGGGFAVGAYGSVYRRTASGWAFQELGFVLDESLHAVWVDPDGGVWAAGGNTFAVPLTEGVLIHRPAAADL